MTESNFGITIVLPGTAAEERDAARAALRIVREAVSPDAQLILISRESGAGDEDVVVGDGRWGADLKRAIAQARFDNVFVAVSAGAVDLSLIGKLTRESKEVALMFGGGNLGGLRGMADGFAGWFLQLPVRRFSAKWCFVRKNRMDVAAISDDGDCLLETTILAVNAGWDVKVVSSGRGVAGGLRRGGLWPRDLKRLWTMRNSSFVADYDHRAFHSRIPLQKFWHARRRRSVRKFVELGDVALNMGSGSSPLYRDFGDCVNADVHVEKLRFLKRGGAIVVRCDAGATPFRDGAFRTVVLSQVIEHVDDPDGVMGEIWRITRRGGTLVIGTVDYGRPWWPMFERMYSRLRPEAYAKEHIRKFTKKSLVALLERHGFGVVAAEYILGSEIIVKAVRK